ncbi:uncharacterized protein LOC128669297 isoform X2 [Plodia interpunctella]|uniref:uncharacterized protein LOC128669297 isoform X2 n=1 Tax=Plodia interpunctella TaxID=58824 RepID=UPI00236842E5|nr:uncharacterized protein LOC128669297 isoform X2 [Plodia interpunctella]
MDQGQLMTVEESYVERRQLFKDIWDTAMHMDEKDGDILNKPKVIKTLRLSEVDRSAGKKKKQRIKNLRAVCKKILEFCDKQDADDIFYNHITTEGHVAPVKKPETHPKKKKLKSRKKIKKTKSLPNKDASSAQAKVIVSDGKERYGLSPKNKPTRNSSPSKFKSIIIKRPYIRPKMGSVAPSMTMKPLKLVSSLKNADITTTPRKLVNKKSHPKNKKKNKTSLDHVSPLKIDVID